MRQNMKKKRGNSKTHTGKYDSQQSVQLRQELRRASEASGVPITQIQKYLKGRGIQLTPQEQSDVDSAIGHARMPQLKQDLRKHL